MSPTENEAGHPPITIENAGQVRLLRTLQLPGFGRSSVSQCSVAFSPDGSMLAGVCFMSTAPVWDARSGELKHVLRVEPVHDVAVAFSADSETIAVGGFGSRIDLFSSATGEQLHTLDPQSSAVWDLAFDPEGAKIASAFFYYTPSDLAGMQQWIVAERSLDWSVEGNTYLSVDYHPGGVLMAFGSLSGGITIVEAGTGRQLSNLAVPSHVGDLAFSPDGGYLAAGSDDNKIRLWRTTDEALVGTWEGHDGYVNGVAFGPDGQWLVSGSHDRRVGLWDVRRGERILWLEGHEDAVLRVAVNPAGTMIASISWDGTVRLWGVGVDSAAP